MRRSIVNFVAVVTMSTLFVGAYVASSPQRAGATGDFRVHNWNMCGYSCPLAFAGVTQSDSPAVVLFIAATSNPKPLAIALNEACFSRLDEIKVAMASLGYHHSASTRVSVQTVGGTCGLFGNAVFQLCGYLSGEDHLLTPAASDPAEPIGRIRRGRCVRFNVFAKPVLCSTHATALKDLTAASQAANFRLDVNAVHTGRCRWIVGDFNITPGFNTGTWFAGYNALYDEVDASLAPTKNSGQKIDYVWIDDTRHGSDHDAVLDNVEPVSDHYYFTASLSFSGTCP